MMGGAPVLLAVTAGMLAAANPCGFALLPAYLSLLVADCGPGPAGGAGPAGRAGVADPARGMVRRAVLSTAAMTIGFVAVFGAFGLVLAPVAGWLQPRLPWVTVALGGGLVLLGGWLATGRALPVPGPRRTTAPRLTGSPGSMVLFGAGYALASLSCAIAPFLAIVVASLRAGSPGSALLLFGAYAGGMGLVVGVTAVAVALVRVSIVRRLRRASAVISQLSAVLLALAGAYVAYYGWYEVRVVTDPGIAGRDPVVDGAATVQRWLVTLIGGAGAGPILACFAALLVSALAVRQVVRRRAGRPPPAAAVTRVTGVSSRGGGHP